MAMWHMVIYEERRSMFIGRYEVPISYERDGFLDMDRSDVR